jgi:hypothetical protein
MQNVSTYLPVRLVEQIEENKGDVSRNLFIKRAISKAVENQNKNLKNKSSKLLGDKAPTKPQQASSSKPLQEAINRSPGEELASD